MKKGVVILLILGIFLAIGINGCIEEEAAITGLQIVLKDTGMPDVKYLEPVIKEVQLQNKEGNWITIWSDSEGKAMKLTSDGAEMLLDTVIVPAGTYIGTRLKVSDINVEVDVNQDGDVLDKHVEIILTEEEFNAIEHQPKPSGGGTPPAEPEQPPPPEPEGPPAITGEVIGDSPPAEPDKPSEPSPPSEPGAPYKIVDGIVYTGRYLDEQHTITLNDYIMPLGKQMWETDFVYSGTGGKIIYDFTLIPLEQIGKQIIVEVSVTP